MVNAEKERHARKRYVDMQVGKVGEVGKVDTQVGGKRRR